MPSRPIETVRVGEAHWNYIGDERSMIGTQRKLLMFLRRDGRTPPDVQKESDLLASWFRKREGGYAYSRVTVQIEFASFYGFGDGAKQGGQVQATIEGLSAPLS